MTLRRPKVLQKYFEQAEFWKKYTDKKDENNFPKFFDLIISRQLTFANFWISDISRQLTFANYANLQKLVAAKINCREN